jgi:acetyltransferase-like isoleucine patch superfamily enzyme
VSQPDPEAPQVADSAVVFEGVRLGAGVRVMAGAVLGRPPVPSKALSRAIDRTPRETVIGERTVIGCNAVIYAGVAIGSDSLVGDNACLREGVSVGDGTIVAMGVTVNYDARIGSRVRIMDNAHVTGNSVIEDDAFVSTLVSTTNDNHMGRQAHADPSLERGPTIRRFATIGQGACLLPGIEIGEDAIVGAGAVVTRNVPPGAVVMGVPARVVRDLRPDERRL